MYWIKGWQLQVGWSGRTFLNRWSEWQGKMWQGQVRRLWNGSELGKFHQNSEAVSEQRGLEEGPGGGRGPPHHGALWGTEQGVSTLLHSVRDPPLEGFVRGRDTYSMVWAGPGPCGLARAVMPIPSQLIVWWHHTGDLNGHGERIYTTEIWSRCCESRLSSFRELVVNKYQHTTGMDWRRFLKTLLELLWGEWIICRWYCNEHSWIHHFDCSSEYFLRRNY